MIVRDLAAVLERKFHKGKVIVLIGPRQVGKTTLMNSLLNGQPFLFLYGDDSRGMETLSYVHTEMFEEKCIMLPF